MDLNGSEILRSEILRSEILRSRYLRSWDLRSWYLRSKILSWGPEIWDPETLRFEILRPWDLRSTDWILMFLLRAWDQRFLWSCYSISAKKKAQVSLVLPRLRAYYTYNRYISIISTSFLPLHHSPINFCSQSYIASSMFLIAKITNITVVFANKPHVKTLENDLNCFGFKLDAHSLKRLTLCLFTLEA